MSPATVAGFVGYWQAEGEAYARAGDYAWMASLVPGRRVLEIGCGPGFGTRALVERSGYSDLLRLTAAASGAKYSDGKLTLHAKGDGAVIELPGGPTYRQCRSLPAKAAPKK